MVPSPHLVIQAAGFGGGCSDKRSLERVVIGKISASIVVAIAVTLGIRSADYRDY
jgi:hypothetical protein